MLRVYRAALGAAVGLALLAAPAAAQVTNGQIFGVVTDQSGAGVPGVTVTLESPALIRPMVDVTVLSGRYEFPIVPIGIYEVTFELTGFKKVVNPNVIIETGFQAEVNAALEIGGLTETVEVSGAAPIVDTRKTSAGGTFTREVMDAIPTARDPWQIVNMAVGVEMSDLNVGGNNSGQQLGFSSRGQGGGDTMWNVEGATITDMAAQGASPTYFDFESFQEIQVTTGGGDSSLQTSGININLITRSGSNVFKGSGRVVYSDKNMQNQNVTEDLFDQGAGSGSPLKHYREYGGEAGGPIIRNQAWWWFAVARQDINRGILGFYDTTKAGCDPPPDDFASIADNQACLKGDITEIINYNGKMNYQWNASNKFQFLYTFGDKTRNARGANQNRSPESVFVQTGFGKGNFNFKHTWVATDKLVFDSLFQYQGGGFNLINQPEVDGVQRLINRDTNFVSRGLYSWNYNIERPTLQVKTDSSYFFSNLLGGDHTTKFGVSYREAPWQTDLKVHGGAEARVSTRYNNPGLNPSPGRACPVDAGCVLGPDRARLYRPGMWDAGLWMFGAYLQDNYTRGRMRLNLGIRWDFQNDEAHANCVPGNLILPDQLPAQCFEGADAGVNFSDIAPRISATYDLFGTGKTVLKAGFAQYFGQGTQFMSDGLTLLLPITMTFQNTTSRTCWNDANGDFFVTADELNLTDPGCGQFPGSYDAETGLRKESEDIIDPDYKNDRTTEFTAGIEHELIPNFAVGVNYINRLYDRLGSWDRIGETKDMWLPRTWNDADFVAEGLQPPSEFGLPSTGWIYYEFNPNLTRPDAIYELHNIIEDRRYHGVDLTITKRFSDRWMLNMATTIQSRKQDPNYCFDCTNNDKVEGINDITSFIVKLNGMYAFPGGWNASANLQIQQGGNRRLFFDGPPSGFRSNGIGSTLGSVTFTAEPYGTTREPMQHLLDMQVNKSFDLRGGQNRLNLILSVFNVLNANTIRGLNNDLNSTNFARISSILAPRVARVQAGITF